MMTREDVLRELELLPVWQLRAPAAPPIEVAQKIANDSAHVKTDVKTDVKMVEIIEQAQVSAATETSYYLVVSDDKNWAFVLPQALTGAAETLFNNILLALQINQTHTETLTKLASVKVIVAMGESVAQPLLCTSESLEKLRGKAHVFEHIAGNIPLVVTYHPNDLLQHLSFKANMWDDLCIAKPLAPI